MDYGTLLFGLLSVGTVFLALMSINEARQENRERKVRWRETKSEKFERVA